MAKQPKALNRTPKERSNTGIKHRKTHLTDIQKVLMGKGLIHKSRPTKS